jgi:hypothetical protein
MTDMFQNDLIIFRSFQGNQNFFIHDGLALIDGCESKTFSRKTKTSGIAIK